MRETTSNAFQAAIAGVTGPFATSRAKALQHDSPPPPDGADSCYGVRSLDNSIAWSTASAGKSNPSNSIQDLGRSAGAVGRARDRQAEHGSGNPLPHSTTSTQPGVTTTPPDVSHAAGGDLDASVESLGQYVANIAAPPPPPMTTPAMSDAPSPMVRPQTPSPLPPISHALFDMLADAPSEPSSPLSCTSLPSLSSLSRISSPADWDWRHPLSRSTALSSDEHIQHDPLGTSIRPAPRAAGSSELVLPTLQLPSTSLHLGLERWNGPGAGTRVALVASPERTRDVLGVLSSRRKCVQLAHGEVGVVVDGALESTILTGLHIPEVGQRTAEAYAALHAVLNPSPNAKQQADLEAVVTSYATSSSSEWVHLTIVLDDETTNLDDLRLVVPVTTLQDEEERLKAGDSASDQSQSSSEESGQSERSGTSTPLSGPAIGETPRCLPDKHEPPADATTPTVSAAALPPSQSPPSYFNRLPQVLESDGESDTEVASEAPAATDLDSSAMPSDHLDPDGPVLRSVALLERVLDEPARVRSASTVVFLASRPSASLSNSVSSLPGISTSPASSFEGGAPMPTVARAQGGGEWEATLSRRLAHRREIDAAAVVASRSFRGQARGQTTASGRVPRPRRRRASLPAQHRDCNPLFPRRAPATSLGLGLEEIFDNVFGPAKRMWKRSSWTQVALACAVAIAVGCGMWAVNVRA